MTVAHTEDLREWWNALRGAGVVPDEAIRVIIDIDWTGKRPINLRSIRLEPI